MDLKKLHEFEKLLNFKKVNGFKNINQIFKNYGNL